MVVIGPERAYGRLPAQALQRLQGLVVGGGGRGCGILRVERHQEQLSAALRIEPLDDAPGRRIAVAHRPVDDEAGHSCLQARRKLLGLRPCHGLERALVELLVPDRLIGMARGERPLAQNDELQERLPEPGRIVDHPAVRQELVQVAPHRPVVGGVGRAEIEQDHANARLGNGGVRIRQRHGDGLFVCAASLLARLDDRRHAASVSARLGHRHKP